MGSTGLGGGYVEPATKLRVKISGELIGEVYVPVEMVGRGRRRERGEPPQERGASLGGGGEREGEGHEG